MEEEKDFFKTCFDTVAGLNVENESQAIAKEVILDEIENLQKENNRLLELCMYALISSTKIYNHELANNTKKAFIDIIKNNLEDDTHTLREKIKNKWEDM